MFLIVFVHHLVWLGFYSIVLDAAAFDPSRTVLPWLPWLPGTWEREWSAEQIDETERSVGGRRRVGRKQLAAFPHGRLRISLAIRSSSSSMVLSAVESIDEAAMEKWSRRLDFSSLSSVAFGEGFFCLFPFFFAVNEEDSVLSCKTKRNDVLDDNDVIVPFSAVRPRSDWLVSVGRRGCYRRPSRANKTIFRALDIFLFYFVVVGVAPLKAGNSTAPRMPNDAELI